MNAHTAGGLVRHSKLRKLTSAILVPAPSALKRVVGNLLLGWEVSPTAHIGLSYVDADHFSLGPGAYVGHFSVFSSLTAVRLGNSSRIGQWNWISSAPLLVDRRTQGAGELSVGEHSAITSRHYLDCSGGVRIGSFSTIAGVRSTFLTHQIDIQSSAQTTQAIDVGHYCFVGSNAHVTPGSSIADRVVLAMGAVVSGHLDKVETLYGGVPARPIKSLAGARYFTRPTGFVYPDEPANT